MEELSRLFEQITTRKPETIVPLKGAGSNRAYYRLSHKHEQFIGVVGESVEENKAFIALAQHFATMHLPTPRVLGFTTDYLYYIQDDLGNISLFDYCSEGINTGIFSEKEKLLLLNTISFLPQLQFEGASNLDFSCCYPQSEFDRNTVMWDLNYFKYNFLKTTGLAFLEPQLEADFEQMACDLLQEPAHTFMYRDFQARNVMIKNEEPYFIDFQGGRKGPIYYDVASFVWQAKANYPPELKEALLKQYLKALKPYQAIDEGVFNQKLQLFLLFRSLQVLGAYGFRGYFEQKPHFIDSIPFAIQNLRELLKNDFSNYPYLIELLHTLCDLPTFAPATHAVTQAPVSKQYDTSKLVVTVTSFSYKKGIPEDPSGNGGGYVFDCRGVHNPGRYENYKVLTGLDKPVIDFLEQGGEIQPFLEAVYKLADAHIQDYLTRGFSSLMFAFGCTGGQHRSVYSAQQLAEYIAKKYGVKVKLTHREQHITKEL